MRPGDVVQLVLKNVVVKKVTDDGQVMFETAYGPRIELPLKELHTMEAFAVVTHHPDGRKPVTWS